MKKIVLSAVAALTLGSVAASAGDVQLYSDANGQVFTSAGEGRTLLKSTPVQAKASKLKFSGQIFLGYKSTEYRDDVTSKVDKQDFELRRGYLQLKAYFLEDKKSYFRVTYDLKRDSDVDGGSLVARAKYAYINLNEVLPATSLEIGLAHRPWHDYEEHNSWMYRSISEILVEDHNGAHLANSADIGAMAKVRTQFLDADIGVFNGEGYHADQNEGNGLSLEWRFTGHLLGTSGKPTKTTYLDASFFGQMNSRTLSKDQADNTLANNQYDDLQFYGLHTVFNMPMFLISGQYITAADTASNSSYVSQGAGSGFSANTEVRLGDAHDMKAFARYDNWTKTQLVSANEKAQRTYIAGAAWEQNKNVEWSSNVTVVDNESGKENYTAYMVTAEVKF